MVVQIPKDKTTLKNMDASNIEGIALSTIKSKSEMRCSVREHSEPTWSLR